MITHCQALSLLLCRLVPQCLSTDLTVLKNMLNEGGNRFNLHQLLFSALSPPSRSTILSHFATEAASFSSLHSHMPIKVLSDIDDTLLSSFLDKRYPKHVLYPGVRQFFCELTRKNMGVYPSVKERAKSVAHSGGDCSNEREIDSVSVASPSVARKMAQLHNRVANKVDCVTENITTRASVTPQELTYPGRKLDPTNQATTLPSKQWKIQ